MEDRTYVIDDENKEPIEISAQQYINHLFDIVRTTPHDAELGLRIRMEYDYQRLAQLILLNNNI